MSDPREARDDEPDDAWRNEYETWAQEQDALDILWHGENDGNE